MVEIDQDREGESDHDKVAVDQKKVEIDQD